MRIAYRDRDTLICGVLDERVLEQRRSRERAQRAWAAHWATRSTGGKLLHLLPRLPLSALGYACVLGLLAFMLFTVVIAIGALLHVDPTAYAIAAAITAGVIVEVALVAALVSAWTAARLTAGEASRSAVRTPLRRLIDAVPGVPVRAALRTLYVGIVLEAPLAALVLGLVAAHGVPCAVLAEGSMAATAVLLPLTYLPVLVREAKGPRRATQREPVEEQWSFAGQTGQCTLTGPGDDHRTLALHEIALIEAEHETESAGDRVTLHLHDGTTVAMRARSYVEAVRMAGEIRTFLSDQGWVGLSH